MKILLDDSESLDKEDRLKLIKAVGKSIAKDDK